MTADSKLHQFKAELPPAPKPVGTYSPFVRVGNIAYLSGHGPLMPDGTLLQGKVGAGLNANQGQQAARQVGLAILATLKANLGSLDQVEQIVKVLGMVNATEDFTAHPQVLNGFSDLMVEVFGPAGRAARSAVGVASLPLNMAVEIEAVVLLKQ